jgi:hypothetical protein
MREKSMSLPGRAPPQVVKHVETMLEMENLVPLYSIYTTALNNPLPKTPPNIVIKIF